MHHRRTTKVLNKHTPTLLDTKKCLYCFIIAYLYSHDRMSIVGESFMWPNGRKNTNRSFVCIVRVTPMCVPKRKCTLVSLISHPFSFKSFFAWPTIFFIVFLKRFSVLYSRDWLFVNAFVVWAYHSIGVLGSNRVHISYGKTFPMCIATLSWIWHPIQHSSKHSM